MSGAWRIYRNAAPAPGKHDHVDLVIEHAHGRRILRLTDPRRFGAVLWVAGGDGALRRHALLAGLGIEPFDPRFDGAFLHAGIRGRRTSIKQVLLSGAVVVGVGNIYASESLFEAAIDPRTCSARLSAPRCQHLAEAIRAVLARAIDSGGSTLRDFTGADGRGGEFIDAAKVYGRNGLVCLRCGKEPIRRIVQAGRATYFCPHCQRR
jgi:formamidopyrimidine-DNA glycosylase